MQVLYFQIALIVDDFKPSVGSYGGHALEICRLLCEEGHSVHIFSRKCEPDRAGITFHKINSAGWPRSFKELSFANKCGRELKKGQFDIVMGFSRCFGANLVRAGGGVHMAWLKGDLSSYPNPFVRAAKKLWRSISPRTYVVKYIEKKGYGTDGGPFLIAVSERVRDNLIRYLQIPAERIKVIYNGVNTERFNPSNKDKHCSEVRAEFGIGGEFLILFAANNFRTKGLLPLLKAVDVLSKEKSGGKLKLMVIGKGDSRRYMRFARKGGWDQNLIFSGPVAQIERYYAAADIFVHPSFYDPCSNVCLEALASGLPVITTRHNGSGEIIEQGRQGFVIDDPWNTQDLAAAIKFFFDDRRRSSASKEARRLAENFSTQKNYAELKNLFHLICSPTLRCALNQ